MIRSPSPRLLSARLKSASALTAVALLGLSGVAFAQEAAPAAPAKEDIETVIVTGTRQSQQSAINRKKKAGTVSDSIVADDIAQFPDKNVGEALGRITGVQLARDFGEGSGVSIRGVEPDLNRIEINGMSTLSTAGNVSVYGGGGRSNDFRELASELVQSIDVFKGFTADMTEGGVGGTVSVKTRKPLDFKKPTFSITGSLQNLDTVDGWKPRTNFFGATKLLDGKLGLMANVTFDNVDTRGDYLRNTAWVRLADFDGSAEKTSNYFSATDTAANIAAYNAITTQAGCNTAYAGSGSAITTQRNNCLSQWYDYSPRVARYGVWTRNDERMSAEFTAQYRFTDRLDAFLSYNRNTRSQRLNDINYGTDFTSTTRLYNVTSATNSACSSTIPSGSTVVDANHNVVQYTAGNCLATSGRGGSNAFSVSARDFAQDTKSDYISYGANYKGESLQVEFQGSNSESDVVTQTNNVSVSYNVPGLIVKLDSRGAPTFTFPSGYSPNDASAVSQWQIQYRPSNAHSEEQQYKLDFDYETKFPVIEKVEWGARATKYQTQGYGYGGFLLSAGSNLSSATDDTVIYSNAVNSTATVSSTQTADQTAAAAAAAAYATGYWSTTESWSKSFSNTVFTSAMTPLPSNFYFGGGAIPSTWLYPDFNSVAQYLDTSHFNLDNLETTTGNDGKSYAQIPYRVEETTDAQYLKANYAFPFNGWDVSGNFGVRRVHTETSATGTITRQEIRYNSANVATTYTVGNSQTSMAKDYTVWLPSFNMGVWFVPNKLSMRTGFAKLMARPLINYLMPSVTCTINYTNDGTAEDDADSCVGGNPALKPYRADQYDLSFEYYPNKDTQFTAGFFYKDIKQFYVSSRVSVGKMDYFGDGTLYYVQTYINGDGAKISGLELTAKTAFTFLPGWMSGFGADVNYTYQEAKDVGLYSQIDNSPLPFPGLSSDSYNATLWYDKGEFNARLAYNYRSKWLVSAADSYGQPLYRDPTGYLDGKVTWKPRNAKGLSLFIEGKNLTKEEELTTAGGTRLTELGYFGRRFFAGFTIKR
ncbi:TonB-dependent receptor [Asticcacaulis excentricus]|uniref:TonB-dependent receptor n=1 Tax=Asticcacaulis excentricus (strain ATCC 15261 / DSM 4724 / KCTC 12464 / NCIMB 9791 / VKM B-1370 / CB 48) TaxID=573065 RepID=E8RTZ8_ASTEC|nr:TonB-dependent receptor [Asticcacaulis excentricus]ADU14969.1 TonB-dependent receptor [Asticcacaulis excentricus CB 48]